MSCRALLEPSALACVECGIKVGESDKSATTHGGEAIQSGRNSLSFQEDRNTRKFEASLTDTAMQALGGVFGDLFAQRGAVRGQQAFSGIAPKEGHLLEGGKQLPSSTVVLPMTDTPSPPPPTEEQFASPQTSDDKARVLKFFSSNGDKLELMDSRLKAASRLDYVRRLTYLFLYAHELHGRMSIPESDLNTVIQTAKMMDASGNARTWIRKRIGIATEGEGAVKLTFKGREDAQKALDNAHDANMPDTWNPDKATQKSKAAKGKKKA